MEKFLLIFAAVALPGQAAANDDFKSISFRKWADETPQIIICDNSVDFSIVVKSVEFWRKHGFKMSNPQKRNNCKSNILKNHIKFIKNTDNSNLKENENGATDRLFTKTKMYGANITIRDTLRDQQALVTHELGHALGLNHSPDVENVMYYKKRYYAFNR
tara:strand:+ start:139 stop:618 length:480 start_codon:yes stop_codon:yes gene_type:complete